MAQQPAWVGTNLADGIVYSEYQMFDHGVVSSYRVMAQNAVADSSLEWNFITAANDYSTNWRPYSAGQVYGAFNSIVDPVTETSSARYNSGSGGQPGVIAEIQAGYYYTIVVENNETADNLMCINETDFNPVIMDTIHHSPIIPTESDMVTFTVELDGSMMSSIAEHVFIRYSIDGFATSDFAEITNFAGGVGTVTVPAFAADATVVYYALSTAEAVPDPATIDYFTLYFGNNVNQNYQFTVSSITDIFEAKQEVGILTFPGFIRFSGIDGQANASLIDMTGKIVLQQSVQTNSNLTTSGLPSGTYMVQIDEISSKKIVIN